MSDKTPTYIIDPECAKRFGRDGEYHPSCCRFPKACSPMILAPDEIWKSTSGGRYTVLDEDGQVVDSVEPFDGVVVPANVPLYRIDSQGFNPFWEGEITDLIEHGVLVPVYPKEET